MSRPFDAEQTGSAGNGLITRWGMVASILTGAAALSALAIALTTAPARSGPNCIAGPCVTYPFTDVAGFVPIEYLWMYPALLIAPSFAGVVLALHYSIRFERRILTHAAILFTFLSTAALGLAYLIQFVVVEPSLLKGELEYLSLWSQYNPHGIFIALEDLGYLTLGISFLFAGLALPGRGRLEKVSRILLITSSLLAMGALLVLALLLGSNLEYQYEVAAILIDWVTLIAAGALLAVYFGRSHTLSGPLPSGGRV